MYSQGPHDIDCLRQWWTDVGCSAKGLSSPDNMADNVESWNTLSGQEVQSDMAAYVQRASERNVDYSKCHGPSMFQQCIGIILSQLTPLTTFCTAM